MMFLEEMKNGKRFSLKHFLEISGKFLQEYGNCTYYIGGEYGCLYLRQI